MQSYVKLALKVLGRRKVFTLISLFGIAMTLAVLVVATAILDDVFEPRAPQSRFDRVLAITMVSMIGPHSTETMNPGYRLIHDYIYTLPGIEAATAFSEPAQIGIYRNGGRTDAQFKRTDAAYWRVLDFRFLEGRPFTADEEQRGALVAVISDGLRKRLFGREAALGRSMEIDGRDFRVIGIVPDVPITRFAGYSDIWVPHTTARSSDYQHALMGNYSAIVLAHTRNDLPRLKREFAARVKRIPIDDPKRFNRVAASLDTPFESFARGAFPARFGYDAAAVMRIVLTIVTLLFMTLPALNLITLNLSRILERASEIGVRKAFGASRGALVTQFVFENVVLTLIGGAIALVTGAALIAALNRADVIPNAQFALNVRVLLYGLVLAGFFGIFSGVYPAWRMSRLHAVDALRGGAQ